MTELDPSQPTLHRPGTSEKILVMAARATARLPLFHKGDAPGDGAGVVRQPQLSPGNSKVTDNEYMTEGQWRSRHPSAGDGWGARGGSRGADGPVCPSETATRRDRRQARLQRIGDLLARGLSLGAISRKVGVNRRQVQRDLEAMQVEGAADTPSR